MQNEKQERRSVISGVCGDMRSSLIRLKTMETLQTNYAGGEKDSVILTVDIDDSEFLLRALGTVQQLLEKQSGNHMPMQGDAVDK